MSAHVEWLAARETSVQVFTPGEDWIGAGEHRQPVLTLAGDDVVAIQGTPAELRALAARITAVATAAAGRLDLAAREDQPAGAATPRPMPRCVRWKHARPPAPGPRTATRSAPPPPTR